MIDLNQIFSLIVLK